MTGNTQVQNFINTSVTNNMLVVSTAMSNEQCHVVVNGQTINCLVIAEDELGNMSVLTADGLIKQYIGDEVIPSQQINVELWESHECQEKNETGGTYKAEINGAQCFIKCDYYSNRREMVSRLLKENGVNVKSVSWLNTDVIVRKCEDWGNELLIRVTYTVH